MKIQHLRNEIDEVDREIIRLLSRRFEIVKEIAKLKKKYNIDIEDDAREKEIINSCRKAAKNLDEKFIKRLMHLILKESKKIQRKN